MFGIRQSLSRGTLAATGVTALLVAASASAASGGGPTARSFLTGAHARGQPAVLLERAEAAFARGRWRVSSSLTRKLDVVEVDGASGYAHTEHAVAGEAVGATLAAAWHADGFTGNGVKVAIIDGGFTGLAERQAAGDLPANVVTQDFCGGKLATASEHGTAVAEIVHEMAPEAELHLLCIGSEPDLAAAVAYAKAQGIRVINHSMGWEGPFRNDGSDAVGAIVADATASGILWVNSAGNEADAHWMGTYNARSGVHAWDANGDVGNTFVWPDGSEICGFLKWDEWPAGVSDFDLGLFLSGSNTLLATSDEEQGAGGGEPPFEAVCTSQSSGADLMVFWAIRGYDVRSNPRIDLVSWSPPLEHAVAAGSIAAPASSPAAFAVGALCWQSRQLEPYSSQGPTVDGRVKPDIVGHDSVSGATYGPFEGCPSAFAGTSASSPEVAGAAALVRQAYPAWAPDQIRQYLMRNARDLGDAGMDSAHGAGELQLPEPPDVVAPTATALVSPGRRGKMLRLRATVSDNSGEVSIVELVKRGRKTVASIKRGGYVSATGSRTIVTRWKVPANAAGAYRHCVRVSDRAGNSSAVSCARLVIR
ncbi:MAG: S8 family serine peptidase [Gaiellaceae bacterium]